MMTHSPCAAEERGRNNAETTKGTSLEWQQSVQVRSSCPHFVDDCGNTSVLCSRLHEGQQQSIVRHS